MKKNPLILLVVGAAVLLAGAAIGASATQDSDLVERGRADYVEVGCISATAIKGRAEMAPVWLPTRCPREVHQARPAAGQRDARLLTEGPRGRAAGADAQLSGVDPPAPRPCRLCRSFPGSNRAVESIVARHRGG